jgi:hypothetical protein
MGLTDKQSAAEQEKDFDDQRESGSQANYLVERGPQRLLRLKIRARAYRSSPTHYQKKGRKTI